MPAAGCPPPAARRQLKEIFDRNGSTIAAERLAIRKTRSRPLVDAFGQWLGAQRARVSRNSRIGEKPIYSANP